MTMKNMNDAYTRIITQNQYTRTSENPLNSEKAMSIRKGLRDLDTWDDNIGTAHELFTTAESSLTQVASNLFATRVKPLLVQGSTVTVGSVGMQAVGTELEQIAHEMVDAMNADFNDRQMFGGLSQDRTPFTIEEVERDDGTTSERVCYLGIDMDTITQGADGLYYGTQIVDGVETPDVLVPGQGQVLLDIGLGIDFDADLNVDPNTAFDTALHGFKILGFGKDEEGYSKNLIQLTLDAAFTAGIGDINRVDELAAYIDKTDEAAVNIRTTITELGVRYNSLDYYLSKNEDSRFSLLERQNTVEGVDLEKEITEYYAIQAAYDASLKMGANVLPRSIFDFI
jgi:flagellar hook-associated protein 3 FlgL